MGMEEDGTVFSRHGEVTREQTGRELGRRGARAKINENEINYKTV